MCKRELPQAVVLRLHHREPDLVDRRQKNATRATLGAVLLTVPASAFVTSVALEGHGHVWGSVWRTRSRVRPIRITTRSSGSGRQTRESYSRQSDTGPRRCFCRQQRHHGLECMHAEVLALRRPDPVRLGHFEVVAELEPTDGAAFDALDGDAQVVEPRFRHAKARIGGSARRFHLASGRVWADDRRCAFLRVSPTRRVP